MAQINLWIGFLIDVPKTDFISVKVYDITGGEVSTLVSEARRPGHYRIEWKVHFLPSGVYFNQLSTSTTRLVRKMLLIRYTARMQNFHAH